MLPPCCAPFPAPDRSGHCRTSTASSQSMRALLESAGSQQQSHPPGLNRSGHMWALPKPNLQLSTTDLNRQRRQLSIALGNGGTRTSSAVGSAGPQPPGHNCSEQCRMPERMSDRMRQMECQTECRIACPIECQIECQKAMPDRMPERMSAGNQCQIECQAEC